MKHILFLTGTRADFGKMYPLASEAKNNGFRVTFLVTGMHMLSEYGLTKMEVHNKKDFEVIEFMNQRHGDPQDIILAKSIIGFSDSKNQKDPKSKIASTLPTKCEIILFFEYFTLSILLKYFVRFAPQLILIPH